MDNSFKNTLNSMRTQIPATESKRLTHTQSVVSSKHSTNVLLEKLRKIANTIINVRNHYLFFQKYTYKEYMKNYNTLVHRKEMIYNNES